MFAASAFSFIRSIGIEGKLEVLSHVALCKAFMIESVQESHLVLGCTFATLEGYGIQDEEIHTHKDSGTRGGGGLGEL